MSKLKPVGSEALPLDDKIKRIMEIARYNEIPQTKVADPNKTTHYIKESANGFYGVVREKDGYYVKHGLTESSLDYIGGMKMKNKNRFNSYAEAVKRLELISKPLSEQEKKYVLDKPSMDEDPATEPAMDDASQDAPPAEAGAEDAPADVPAPDAPMGDEVGAEPGGDLPEHMKVIQKLTGKLGQRLRQFADQLKSDDYKYVINSVLSAIDLTKLEDSDKEEIAARFEPDYGDSDELDSVGDSEFGDVGGDDFDDEVPAEDGGEEAPAPAPEEEEVAEEEFDDIYENFIRLQKIMKG